MRISKIAKLCKEEKRICTTDTEVGVWIGNGYCVYLLPEFKYLEQDGIALAFGISAKDKSKIFFHKVPLTTLCLEDFDESETICEQMDFSFSKNKGTVQAYKTQEGVLFLRTDMLAPLRDEIENVEIYLRHTTENKPYFAAKIGMQIYAIFLPAEIINQNFIEHLEEFNALCRMKFQNDCAEQKQDYEQARLEGVS